MTVWLVKDCGLFTYQGTRKIEVGYCPLHTTEILINYSVSVTVNYYLSIFSTSCISLFKTLNRSNTEYFKV